MEDARETLRARLGVRPLHRIHGGATRSWSVGWSNARTALRAFAKLAVDEPTAGFLRDEHRVYSQLAAPFIPELLAWDDDGELPILVIEDLSEAHWPPPWRPGDTDAVLDALDALHETEAPGGLPALTLGRSPYLAGGRGRP